MKALRAMCLSQIGVDRSDLSKVFVQLTLEFLSKQVNLCFAVSLLLVLFVNS